MAFILKQVGQVLEIKLKFRHKRLSEWTVKGNNILSNNSPVILQWNNKEGVILKKRIELDDKYLFKISQQVK